jgi:deoxyadenosine/deoxycytidine kinase
MIIGIAGGVCSGKTSMAQMLKDKYPEAVVYNMKEIFMAKLAERGHEIWDATFCKEYYEDEF